MKTFWSKFGALFLYAFSTVFAGGDLPKVRSAEEAKQLGHEYAQVCFEFTKDAFASAYIDEIPFIEPLSGRKNRVKFFQLCRDKGLIGRVTRGELELNTDDAQAGQFFVTKLREWSDSRDRLGGFVLTWVDAFCSRSNAFSSETGPCGGARGEAVQVVFRGNNDASRFDFTDARKRFEADFDRGFNDFVQTKRSEFKTDVNTGPEIKDVEAQVMEAFMQEQLEDVSLGLFTKTLERVEEVFPRPGGPAGSPPGPAEGSPSVVKKESPIITRPAVRGVLGFATLVAIAAGTYDFVFKEKESEQGDGKKKQSPIMRRAVCLSLAAVFGGLLFYSCKKA